MNLREGIVLGVCNALLDISANVDEQFLKKYNLERDNAILAEPQHMPIYDDLITHFNPDYIAGGSVQNSLRVAQWILEKPNITVYFGCVGDDKYAKILEERAKADGVNVQYQHTSEAPTGTCAVLVTNTHRSLCANLAAAIHFSIDHIQKPENKKLIDNAEYYYISGFFVAVSVPTIIEIAKTALEHNRLFIMNLSAPYIPLAFKDALEECLPYVDIIFGNEGEAEAFAQAQNWDTKDLREIGKKMLQLPKANKKRSRVVILTQGKDPVLLIEKDKISEFNVPLLEHDKMVDTNGAGDAFVGGFIGQLVQGKSFDVCIRCGIWAARQIIQRSGCTFEGKADFKE
ncbi:uncharacterized protein LOC129609100 isoform X2 [Condylostylus longicornis]|uniref:uncharacterized protein LOC129609100 isoform X2 n=1 Tax=Condylostylus longicornis TaxID=2530218 RepID=UPI00244DB416|nr:uncharacterized protein LOC129609100 isoform X2 [Condylostylus longicornis]